MNFKIGNAETELLFIKVLGTVFLLHYSCPSEAVDRKSYNPPPSPLYTSLGAS